MTPELSVSLAGLERRAGAPWGGGPRAGIEWAAGLGFRSVTLDGTAAGVRARDLDRSGRRDLSALLRRLGLSLAGIDLWIPPAHLSDAGLSERAVAAIVGAIELAADLKRLGAATEGTVHGALPGDAHSAIEVIDAAAESAGVGFADYGGSESAPPPEARRGIGIDPGAVLLGGGDPTQSVMRAGRSLRGARLSDADLTGRVTPGSRGGRLNGPEYLAALSVAAFPGAVVLDLRGVRDQGQAAAAGRAWWDRQSLVGG